MRAEATLSSRFSSSFCRVSGVVWMVFFLAFLAGGLVLNWVLVGGLGCTVVEVRVVIAWGTEGK